MNATTKIKPSDAAGHGAKDRCLLSRALLPPRCNHDHRGTDAETHTDERPYPLRGSFVSLLLWEGRSLTHVAEQAGHSVATLARHYAGTMRELENKPRIPAAEAIRQAREESGGRTQDAPRKSSMTGSRRIPCNYRSGRCWARTSDLRLVETALSQLS